VIRLSRTAAEAIREHGRRAYPEECCGALLGEKVDGVGRVARAEPVENSRADRRERRFRIAPLDYLRLERLAAAEGRALLGFYHSHPDHPAVPSEYDREHALPFFHYVVLRVASGEPGEMASWVLSEDRRVFDREELLAAGTGE
jgi:proteasome lid subunit RPN8/RPN11